MDAVINDTCRNCDLLIGTVKDHAARASTAWSSSSSPGSAYNMAAFWTKLTQAGKAVSHEATKLAIAFSTPPLPDVSAARSMCGTLFNAASHLVGGYLDLPIGVGSYLHEILSYELTSTLAHIKHFLETLQKVAKNSVDPKSCMEATGKLWEFCDKIPNLPADNKQAVIRLLKQEEALIMDAFTELRELSSSGGSDSEDEFDELDVRLSARSLELVLPISGLVKTVIGFFRRSRKTLESSQATLSNQHLDCFAGKMKGLSRLVDDLASSLYPPMEVSNVLDSTNALKASVGSAIDSVKLLASEDDQKWIEVLVKAVDHNVETIHSKASSA